MKQLSFYYLKQTDLSGLSYTRRILSHQAGERQNIFVLYQVIYTAA